MNRGNRLVAVGAVLALTVTTTVHADDGFVGDGDPGITGETIEAFLLDGVDPLSAFGPDYVLKVIPGVNFRPKTSHDEFEYVNDGYFYLDNGWSLHAGLDLPIGSELALICLFIYDNDPFEFAGLVIEAYEMGSATDNPETVEIGNVSSGFGETPGYDILCANPDPDPVIRAYADLDGDNDKGYIWYQVEFRSGSNTALVQLGGGLVIYRRTISPAPAVATFPDVDPSFWAFQEIEALAASGITQGFPDGNFRPFEPVTRAQMATFLARALGLHWPQ